VLVRSVLFEGATHAPLTPLPTSSPGDYFRWVRSFSMRSFE